MSTYEGPRRMGRSDAERLVRGGPDAWRSSRDPIVGLLAAVSAPGSARELAGKEEALAAFRATPRDRVPQQPRRWPMIRATIAKFLTVKVAAICVASLSVGGVAVAATTGNLPGPLNLPGPFNDHGSPAAPPTDWPWPSTPSSPGMQTPPPGMLALCQAYLGWDDVHRGTALHEDHGFHELVAQVGAEDREKADRYCDQVMHGPSAPPTAPPSGQPMPTGQPPRPTDLPPTAWPTSRPSVVPSDWPTPTHN
jgi:hypothetical protein